MLSIEKARELIAKTTHEEHLLLHAISVCAAMEAMAEKFGEDSAHWAAVGYLHDFDYEQYPQEHLAHTEKELLAEGVDA